MTAHTHSPARRTSAACAGSAEIEGMRRNSASSSNHGSGMRRSLDKSRDVAQLLRLREGAALLEALVLDLADPLAGYLERAADFVQRARLLAGQAVAKLEHAALAIGEGAETPPERGGAEGGVRSFVGQRRRLV